MKNDQGWALLCGAWIKRSQLLLLLLSTALLAACTPPPDNPGIGYLDQPLPGLELEKQNELIVAGWVLDQDGVDRIEVRVNDNTSVDARLGIKRRDVQKVYPDRPGSLHAGFQVSIPLDGLQRGIHNLVVNLYDSRGHITQIGSQQFSLAGESVWTALLASRPALAARKFHLAIATSNVSNGGANEIKSEYQRFESDTIKVAFRVPLLYMRSTLGELHDWQFDPDFYVETAVNGKVVAEDSLNGILEQAKKDHLPVLITLNGGIWSDASGSAPQWDLTDYLEEEPLNVQWNEDYEAMADDYLSSLPGSMAHPQLARSLTLSYYADDVRRYKRRNLQQAGKLVQDFAKQHPELLVGINLDPDVYLNPFFHGKQWYDYNPAAVRQFREWISGTGAYAPEGELHNYQLQPSLNLNELNKLSKKGFASWEQVEPPKPSQFSRLFPYWKNGYVHLWQQFRRHLVDMHYDDLSVWLTDVGLSSDSIFSSQGFAHNMDPKVDVFPVYVNDPPINHDTGGVSIEGSMPVAGHLGAIFYGWSAKNEVVVGTGDSLYAAIRKFDRSWGVSEFNQAFLEFPKTLPSYDISYKAIRDMFNFGAKFISPMAWNGWNGTFQGEPGFQAYTSYRNTPAEQAMRDFMVSHADLPHGAILWPFGSQRYAATDGWTANADFKLQPGRGALTLSPQLESREVVLESPGGQVFEAVLFDLLVLGFEEAHQLGGTLTLQFKENKDDEWIEAIAPVNVETVQRNAAGWLVPLQWREGIPELASAMRIIWKTDSGIVKPLLLDHIALYPREGQG